MNKYALALVGSLLAGSAMAQTTSPSTAVPTTPSRPAPAMTTTPGTPAPVMTPAPGTAMTAPGTTTTTPGTAMTTPGTAANGMVTRNTGTAAASGDRNQAVATTAANAMQPAHGRNSFTMGEARRRLQRRGFANVTDLKKDSDGVWRGTASKDGASTGVWLDYKGNIGQQ